MKQLFLIRHAKSSWGNAQLKDFDRPLNHRGRAAAPEMGDRLVKAGIFPDVIISSPAVRAFTTAKLISKRLKKTGQYYRKARAVSCFDFFIAD